MSSRALRRAQKEREAAQLAAQEEESEQDEVEPLQLPSKAQASVFALLNDEEPEEDEDLEEPSVEVENRTSEQSSASEEVESVTIPLQVTPKSSAKNKKKKKKKGKKAKTADKGATEPNDDLDEIDRALKTLSAGNTHEPSALVAGAEDPALTEVCKLLAIDSTNLRVENEMRRLFGKVALEPEHSEEPQRGHGRRQGQPPGEGASLSEAVTGKNSQGGSGLSAVLRRRNIFIPGREDWPRATGGGLTMDIVGTRPGGIVEYTYVHNSAYQNQQREFEACVTMMDPSTMVNLLRFNPYHVSTLLQVSEIAKHDRDPATSGELLERALFSFGRAVHSSFAQNLAAGKARLDFRRPENREFWLAAWRYINNIALRATWRTAYEWAKLLLGLDPENDPYRVCLVIDQLAVRAKQSQSFVDLCQSSLFAEKWSSLPNIQYSKSLALRALDVQGSGGIEALTKAAQRFPWVAARLFQDLSIDKIPPGVWGASASSPIDILYTELYLTQGLDMWKQPETSKFLADVVANVIADSIDSEVNMQEISIDEARFVYLTDKPALIGLVPRSITSTIESASDPLPPMGNLTTYQTELQGRRQRSSNLANRPDPRELAESDPQAFIDETNDLQRFFELLIPGFSEPPATAQQPRQTMPGAFESEDDQTSEAPARPPTNEELNISEEAIDEAIARSGLSISELRGALTRFVALRETLIATPEQTIRAEGSGDVVTMLPNGMTTTTTNPDDRGSVDQLLEELHDEQTW